MRGASSERHGRIYDEVKARPLCMADVQRGGRGGCGT